MRRQGRGKELTQTQWEIDGGDEKWNQSRIDKTTVGVLRRLTTFINIGCFLSMHQHIETVGPPTECWCFSLIVCVGNAVNCFNNSMAARAVAHFCCLSEQEGLVKWNVYSLFLEERTDLFVLAHKQNVFTMTPDEKRSSQSSECTKIFHQIFHSFQFELSSSITVWWQFRLLLFSFYVEFTKTMTSIFNISLTSTRLV